MNDVARWLHRSYFGTEPPADLIERYDAACTHCGLEADERIARAAILALDPEALEYALRRRGDLALTKRTQVLFYLAEVRAEYRPFFFNDQPRPLAGKVALLGAGLRSAWKLLLGEWHLRRLR